MKKYILFGTGQYGREAYNALLNDSNNKIIGICDSNQAKHGQDFFDFKIKSLAEYANVDYDVLLLCAAKWENMLKSVVALGYDVAKIKIYNGGIKSIDESYMINIHSQDGEELYLREKFAEKDTGIYVDVGAFHPTWFSNTMWAYKKGWKGINIEPNPDGIELFNIFRPNDININCGVSNISDTLKYYRFQEGALNTFSYNRVKHLKKIGYQVDSIISIPVVPLQQIFDQYNFNKINFLDIDVEENELSVLESIDFNKVEINVIMVEQLDMSLHEIVQSEVAKLLLDKGFIPKQKYNRTVIYEK